MDFVTGLNLDAAAGEIFWIETDRLPDKSQSSVLKRMSYMGEVRSQTSVTGLGFVAMASANSLMKIKDEFYFRLNGTHTYKVPRNDQSVLGMQFRVLFKN